MDVFQNYQDIWQNYDDIWYGKLPADTDGLTKYIFRAGVLSMDKIEKPSYDQIEISVFFDLDLDPNESLVSHTVTSTNIDTGADSTALVIAADEREDQQVNIVIKAGQAIGERHKITVSSIADTATTIEKDIFLSIIDLVAGNLGKQPADNFLVKIDFSNLMALTETLDDALVDIECKLNSDGSDVTAALLGVSRVSDDGQGIIFVVKGGVSNESYTIYVRGTCVDAVQGGLKKFQRSIILKVREI